MNTTISVSLPSRDAVRVRKTAKRRGFPSTSEYLRYLIKEGQGEVITEEDILRSSRQAERLYKQGKLKAFSSLEEAMKDFEKNGL